MYGIAIGDITGSVWEGGRPNEEDYALLHPSGHITDDTCLAMGIMEALLWDEDYERCIKEWCRRYPEIGYGLRFKTWAMSDNPLDHESDSNGAGMRAGPIGWALASEGKSIEDVLEQAHKASICSHSDPLAWKGAQAVALATHQFALGAKPGQVIKTVKAHTGYEPAEPGAHFQENSAKMTVPVALWAALTGKSFEDAISRAIYAGGDTDTIGAMTGAMAEGRFGVSDHLRTQSIEFMNSHMVETIIKFYDHFPIDRPGAKAVGIRAWLSRLLN